MNKTGNNRNILLAIETSVQGGSLALLEGDKEIDNWQGSGSVSKSEDVLDEISKLLKKNGIENNEIRQILVSRGPGSFTGTRIGLAIALGLKKSLDCSIRGVSVLAAMAAQADGKINILAAIKIGVGQVCFQRFEIGQRQELSEITKPCLVESETFMDILENEVEASFVVNENLYKFISVNLKTGENRVLKTGENRVISCGENLAITIGDRAAERIASDNVSPIYIQDARFTK